MFDRFLLPQEPPPVEWPDDGDSEPDMTRATDGKRMVAEISKVLGMLTKLLKDLKDQKESKED
jgi:hypothetical protein